jgi:hypothetical protein
MTGIPAHASPTGRQVSVYADPACPRTWVTSQWLRQAAPHRNLDLRRRSLSLWLRDTDQPAARVPAEIRAHAAAARAQSHRLLRVFEALRAAAREHDIDHLYRLWGERAFLPSRPPAPPGSHLISEIVTAAGLRAEWAATADDPAWDAAITASMNAAAAACGPPYQPHDRARRVSRRLRRANILILPGRPRRATRLGRRERPAHRTRIH